MSSREALIHTRYNELYQAVSSKNWERAYRILKSMTSDELRSIEQFLASKGVNPRETFSDIIENYISYLVNNNKYTEALRILEKEKNNIDPMYVEKALTVILYNCGVLGDRECIDRALKVIQPTRENITALLAGLYEAVKQGSNVNDILFNIADTASMYGLTDELAGLYISIYKDSLVNEIINTVKNVNEEIGKKLSSMIKEAIKSGDPEKILRILREHGDILKDITYKNNMSMYDFLNALANYFRLAKNLENHVNVLSNMVSTVVEKLENGKFTDLGKINIDKSRVEAAIKHIEKLLNDESVKVLRRAGLLNDEALKQLRQLLAYAYLCYGALLLAKRYPYYNVYLSKAVSYDSSLEPVASTIEIMAYLPRVEGEQLIECILRKEGIL